MTSVLRNLCAAAMLSAAAFVAPATAAVVSLSGPTTVAPGGSFQIDVVASGFIDLYAFQFDIAYNPTLFASTGVTEGSLLSSGGTTFFGEGVDNLSGAVEGIFDTLIAAVPGVSGSGVLAHLTFNAKGARFSTGDFQITNLLALDSQGGVIDASVRGLAVTIPEPSSVVLALAALGFGVWAPKAAARRERRSHTAVA